MAAVSGFIASHGGWVIEAAQHGALTTGQFFQRIEVLAESLPFGPEECGLRFADLANEFRLDWRMSDTDVRKRVVVLVGREDHCLADLLYRWRSGDLRCEIPAVISNHPDLRPLVEWTASSSSTCPSQSNGGPRRSPTRPRAARLSTAT